MYRYNGYIKVKHRQSGGKIYVPTFRNMQTGQPRHGSKGFKRAADAQDYGLRAMARLHSLRMMAREGSEA